MSQKEGIGLKKYRVRINVDISHSEIIEAENKEAAEQKGEELFDELSFDDYNGINIMPDIRVFEVNED